MPVAIMKNTYELLTDKIDAIKADIKVNTEEIQVAASFGDLSENAEYEAAKERQTFLFNTLNRFEKYLNCKVVDSKDIKSDEVTFGTTIRIEEVNSGSIKKYNIVGPVEYELETMNDIVTYTAPLAKQLIGKKVGDVVEVRLPSRVDTFRILEISPI